MQPAAGTGEAGRRPSRCTRRLRAAQDTLGAAVGSTAALPEPLATTVVEIVREAFVSGMQLTAGIAAVVALGIAVLTLRTLRQVPSGNEREAARPEPAAQTGPGAAAAWHPTRRDGRIRPGSV